MLTLWNWLSYGLTVRYGAEMEGVKYRTLTLTASY